MTDFKSKAKNILGPRVAAWRLHRGITQRRLGELCGYLNASAAITINRIENRQALPPFDRFFVLAQALGIKPHELINPACVPAEGWTDRAAEYLSWQASSSRDAPRRMASVGRRAKSGGE